MEPENIAVVIPKYGLVGGAEGAAAALTEQLALDPALEIHVFANRWQAWSDRVFFHHVPVIRFPRFLTTISFACFAQKAIDRAGMDLIHAHDRMFRPHIYTMHGLPHRVWVKEVRKKRQMSLFDRSTAWVEKRMVEDGYCQYYLAVSSITRDIFLNEYHIDSGRVPIIHPGIEAVSATIAEKGVARSEMLRKYGLPPADPVILFVSMNFDIKGLDPLMAGLGRMKQLYPDQRFTLLIVGRDNQKKYERLAHQAGIAGQAVFTGLIPREDLDGIYRAGDIYAMLSKFDTFGMVVLEAMSRGLPVVISGNVGAKDLIVEGVNGFVIDNPHDANYVAGVLHKIIQGDVKRDMGKAALETSRNYSWERTAQKVKEIYMKILANKQRA
ncbi:MAG: glycosyltransferase family 4 protein [Syntrophales bacterium]